jgi:hypothetical protein
MPINPHRRREVERIVNDFYLGYPMGYLAERYGKPRAAIEAIIRKFVAPAGRRAGTPPKSKSNV